MLPDSMSNARAFRTRDLVPEEENCFLTNRLCLLVS